MSATIRLATDHDIATMYDISCSVHLTPLYEALIPPADYERFRAKYTPTETGFTRYQKKLRGYLSDPAWSIWVAETAGVIAGFTISHDEEDALVLKGLFVDEAHQGQGIGKQLFLTSCVAARHDQLLVLEVIEGNTRAINMYERAGFRYSAHADKPFYGARMLRMQKY